jgi:hypothetical protein
MPYLGFKCCLLDKQTRDPQHRISSFFTPNVNWILIIGWPNNLRTKFLRENNRFLIH